MRNLTVLLLSQQICETSLPDKATLPNTTSLREGKESEILPSLPSLPSLHLPSYKSLMDSLSAYGVYDDPCAREDVGILCSLKQLPLTDSPHQNEYPSFVPYNSIQPFPSSRDNHPQDDSHDNSPLQITQFGHRDSFGLNANGKIFAIINHLRERSISEGDRIPFLFTILLKP